MRTPLKFLRGLLGIGAVGALVGGGLAGALWAVVELVGGTVTPRLLGAAFMVGAGLGFSLTTAFGLVLAVTARGRPLEQLSFWRATTVSGIVGACLPLALSVVGGGALSPLATGAPAIAICGLFGAFLGGTLVALGKEARLRELAAGDTRDGLIEH